MTLKQSLGMYIGKVLKQVHPKNGFSGEALNQMEHVIMYVLKKVMEEVNSLVVGHKQTISERDVEAAVKLVLPGELVKHARSEGQKAVTKFNAGKQKSRSERAGLQFPVSRVENLMRTYSTVPRMGKLSAVYLSAVLEYITAEISELSGNCASDHKRVRITQRDIMLAIKLDSELNELFCRVTIGGGVMLGGNVF